MNHSKWTFEEFELDVAAFQLRRRSRPVKLERIPLDLLILLVERPGHLVSREEIATRLWGNGVHVDAESGINTAIRKLRAALNDSAEQPALIETVPSKGYRFIGPVSVAGRSPVTAKISERPQRPWQVAGFVTVLAVALAAVGAAVYYGGSRPGSPASAAPVTIAVLPFQNLSSDPEQEYFSDGLTEETIGALGRITPPRIRVIARTSSMAYKGTRKPANQIGAELGANYIVESSVRRDPARIRITSRLIRVEDQVQVWTASYDRAPAGILGIQHEIGSAIAKQIGAEITSPTGDLASRRTTEDPDAHDLYLRGKYYTYQRTPDSMRKSVDLFEAALQKDPSFALAHAGLAHTHIVQTLVSAANPVEQRKKARAAVDKALSLDPNLAEAHTAAGMASFFMDWEWEAAERSLRRAIGLDPNSATAHQFYAHLLSNWRRHDEAIAEIQKAREIDPLSPMMHTFAGGIFVMGRRYGDALPPLDQALALNPEFFPAHSVLGLLYQRTGNPDGAIEEFRKAYLLSGGNIVQLAYQGSVLGRMGRRAEAQQIIATMSQISQNRFVPPVAFAIVHEGLGDHDAAFQWLEKAYEERDVLLVFLFVDPRWDSLRPDARFQLLLRRCRFPV